MAWATISLSPGLNVELTPTLNRTGYANTNLGRFKSGLFQKLGGWARYFPNKIAGEPLRTHAYQDIDSADHLLIGTTTGFLNLEDGVLSTLTPQQLSTNTAINFTTTAGSPTVTVQDGGVSGMTPYNSVFFNTPVSVGGLVLYGEYGISAYVSGNSYSITASGNATANVSHGGYIPAFTTSSGSPSVSVAFPAHGLLVEDQIVFPVPTTISGLTIQGRYVVAGVGSANTFTITASAQAANTQGPIYMNGNSASFLYDIAIGPPALGSGYGAGNYSAGEYGIGEAITAQQGSPLTATDWTIDNWGEIAVACPENGGLYIWNPAQNFATLQLVPTAPRFNTGIFFSNAQRVIVAYGSTADQIGIGVYQDPLLIRWCDLENYTDWRQLITTQAGEYSVPSGSKIVGGTSTPHRNLIWTDLDLWGMDYIGAELAFNLNKIGSNCGLIAKHAVAMLNDVVFWMGSSNFYMTNLSQVQPLPCPVWDAVFQDLDTANAHHCFAGSNSKFSEVWFFFPSISGGGNGYPDKYVKYNLVEGVWDYGTLQRNTWINQSVIGNPIATTSEGDIFQHEIGTDAETTPLNASFETGFFYINEGEDYVFVDRIFPDFKWSEWKGDEDAGVQITVRVVKYAGDEPVEYGPFTVTKAKRFISKRFRARQIAFKFESTDMGTFWRLGNVRIRYSVDGKGG